jgi:hypothetical protein
VPVAVLAVQFFCFAKRILWSLRQQPAPRVAPRVRAAPAVFQVYRQRSRGQRVQRVQARADKVPVAA